MGQPGQVIILNGAPRSGKTSIAKAIQQSFDGVWLNVGVDAFMHASPDRYHPSIGLRPGCERPDLEPLVFAIYESLFESISVVSRSGIHVVVDVSLHDSYATLKAVPSTCLRRLEGLPLFIVGVKCPVEVLEARRSASGRAQEEEDRKAVMQRLALWDREVHRCLSYDLEVDTSILDPEECAKAIRARLASSR